VEQAILAMLGIIITLMLYLDRGRRADDAMIRNDMSDGNAQIRKEMSNGNAQIRKEMSNGNAQIRKEMSNGNAQIRQEMQDGLKQVHNRLDKLTDIVMDLCRRVGRLEGRAGVFEPRPDTSQ